MTEIIVGVLALIGTAFGSLAGIFTSQKLTNFRMDQLETKVDKITENTNSTNERVVILEKDNIVQWKEITEIKDEIKVIKSKL